MDFKERMKVYCNFCKERLRVLAFFLVVDKLVGFFSVVFLVSKGRVVLIVLKEFF